MSKTDFQNGFIVGFASGGVVAVEDTSKMDALETLIDESGVLSGTEGTVEEKVEQLIGLIEESTLPDWDEDSPIIATDNSTNTTNVYWEFTEKGTFRWRIKDVNSTANKNKSASLGTNTLASMPEKFLSIASKIKQMYVENGIESVGFAHAPNCERIRLPDTLKSRTTFNSLTSMKEFDISSDLNSSLSDYQFAAWTKLEKVLLCPLLTTIPRNCFQDCRSLYEIDFDNITTFEQQSFSGCIGLNRDLVFNKNLTSISLNAFSTTTIKSVKFQNSTDNLPTIRNNAFSYCQSLKDIYCPWDEGAVADAPWGATNATIHYNYVEGE